MGTIMFLDRNTSVCICLLRNETCYIHQSYESKPSGLQQSLCYPWLLASSSNLFVVIEVK